MIKRHLLIGVIVQKMHLGLAVLLILTNVFCTNSLYGQARKSNLHTTNFLLEGDTLIPQVKTIVPSSVDITSHILGIEPEWEWTEDGLLFSSPIRDSLSLSYRTLPINVQESESLLDRADQIKKSKVIKISNDYTQEELEERRLISSEKLSYTGSFTRGVNLGNTQDLVLNSDFNLQMQGDLGNGLRVNAAISDDNIPIQPEGNTQVLQEFDKVFIELTKNRTSLIAGDYQLGMKSYFMKYNKKLKGFSASNVSSLGKNWQIQNRGSFAISRGKFTRIELGTSEGNQGPYKLEGQSNELFLQVLSGTEKIYADGRLLKRGENHDYTIDYNRAEITFTAALIISANLRIIAEYEYATQQYLRSLYASETVLTNDKWEVRLNYYNEQDSKTLSGDIQLDSLSINALEESGDEQALRSGIFEITEESDFEGLIKYRIDNSILTHVPSPMNEIVYGANFSSLGEGRDDYNINTEAGVNGRVYEYVGQGQGTFSPFLPLVAPEKKQLITASTKIQVKDSTELYLETGLSHDDRNRLSSANGSDADNIGHSLHGLLTDERIIGKNNSKAKTKIVKVPITRDTIKGDTVSIDSFRLDTIIIPPWILRSEIEVEHSGEDFRALNPYRDTEFFRDWNLDSEYTKSNETLYRLQTGVQRGRSTFSYQLRGFRNRSRYAGRKHILKLNHTDEKWQIDGVFDILDAESKIDKSQFLRPKLLVSRNVGKRLTIGGYYEKERNRVRSINDLSLQDQSINYDLYKAFISTDQSRSLIFSAHYIRRIDDRIVTNDFKEVSISDDYSIGGKWRGGKVSDLDWLLTFRDFKSTEDNPSGDESKKTFLGRVTHKLILLNKGLIVDSYYESNSGQEPRLEFQYVEVQQGEGSYRWEDFNGDSLRQVNEFVIANFADQGSFEKISVFNNEFLSTNKSEFNVSLRAIPKRFVKKKKGLASRVQSTMRYRLDQRSLSDRSDKLVRFLNFDLADTNLVSFTTSVDLNVFFDRGNAKRDFQLSHRRIANRLVQITGFEERSNFEYYGKSRINITKPLDFITEVAIGKRNSDSEMFSNQRYAIDYWQVTPQLSYRPSQKLRFITKYKHRDLTRTDAPETALIQNLSIESTWRKSSTSNLNVSADLVFIKFDGSRNTPAEIEMLQGLNPGTNYLWNLNYTRRVSKNFDLILNYNGRKSEAIKAVHNAGIQLRAIF